MQETIGKTIFLFYPPIFDVIKFDEIKAFFFSLNDKAKFLNNELDVSKNNDFPLDSKLVFVNFLLKEEEFLNFSKKIEENLGRKITNVLLINIPSFSLIEEIRNDYLICPGCQSFYSNDKEQLSDLENFFCNKCKQSFTFDSIEKFVQKELEKFFKGTKLLMEKIISKNDESLSINISQVNISSKEELFSSLFFQKIKNLIESI